MEKKQSSVEWLAQEIDNMISFIDVETSINFKRIVEQAKAMHKEEIEEAYGHGQNNGYMYANQRAITISKENYFKQTFG